MRSVASARGVRSVERVARSGTRRAERVRREERVVRVNRAIQVHEIQHPPQSQLVDPTQRLDLKSSNNAVGSPLVKMSAN